MDANLSNKEKGSNRDYIRNSSNNMAVKNSRNPLNSVGFRLFSIFFVCIVSLVVALGVFSYNKSKTVIQEQVADATEQTIYLAADGVDQSLRGFEDITFQLLTDTGFMQNLRVLSNSSTSPYEHLIAIQEIGSRFSSLFFTRDEIANASIINVTETGRNISLASPAVQRDVVEEDWLQHVVSQEGRLVWLPVRADGYYGTNNHSFAVARLMRDQMTGARNYVLIIEIKEEYLSSTVEGLNLSGNTPVMIIDENNNIVRTPFLEDLGTPFEIALSEEQRQDALTQASSTIIDNKLTVFKKMELSQWTVIAAVPVAELTRGADQIANLTMIMVVIAMVVAIGAGLLIVLMVGRPLIKLRNLMHQGAQGNLTVRTSIGSRDEIGQVGLSFNRMMEQITKLVQETGQSAAEVLDTSNVLLNVSKQTAISAKEIALATEEIANGASSLAIEAEKGNNITYEITAKMNEVAAANSEMDSATAEVEQVSERGTVYMTDLISRTSDTEQMTRNMVEKVDRLKESTSSIKKILDVLDNISKQTNILSLNATIEAARAGAAGKGFMVVADEIRRLAEQSKESIEVVGEITENIQQEIDETVAALSDAYPVFQQQISSVKEADEIFKQVRNQMGGLGEKLAGVTESILSLERSQTSLADAMSNVSAVSEESSATSEEVASLSNEQLNVSEGLVKLSENLKGLSISLQEQLEQFKV